MEKIIGLKIGDYTKIAKKLGTTRQTVSRACNGQTDTELAKQIQREAVLMGGIRVKPKSLKYKLCEESEK